MSATQTRKVLEREKTAQVTLLRQKMHRFIRKTIIELNKHNLQDILSYRSNDVQKTLLERRLQQI